MSITSGFYDSQNGDRRYTAKEMSAIFNGIINDGVLASIGDAFAVKAGDGSTITVGEGRAWFNSTWIYNDALLSLVVPESTLGYTSDKRVVDVVVLEVNRSEAVRSAEVKIVGPKVYESIFTVEQAVDGAVDEFTTQFNSNSQDIQRYPLAAICRIGGSTDIVTQSNIYNYIGTNRCPFVTGILQVQSIDNIVAQWQSEFDTWFASLSTSLDGDVAVALLAKITNLENGTTPAGNANKLGGKDPSYYAKRSDLDTINPGAIMSGPVGGPLYNGGEVPVATSAFRNIAAATEDLVPGTSYLPTGMIFVVYE